MSILFCLLISFVDRSGKDTDNVKTNRIIRLTNRRNQTSKLELNDTNVTSVIRLQESKEQTQSTV